MAKSLDHCTRRFHHPMSKQHPQLVPESSQCSEQNNEKCEAATDFPEIMFGLGSVDDAGKVHAIIGGEEG